MLAEDERVRSLETDIAILKRDISQFNILFAKLDITIEKLGDVSNNISKLLAVHEERIDFLQGAERDMERKLEAKSQEIKEVSNKLESINKYLVGELSNTENNIKEELSTIRSVIEDKQKEQLRALEDISKKVQHIEKWKWLIIGFAAAAGGLVDKLPNLFNILG